MNIALKVLRHLRIKTRNFWDFELFEKRGIPAIKKEKISKSAAVKWLPEKPVIVDCGAFDGSDSITLSRLTGGIVHAVEADPLLYEKLRYNTRKYKAVRCHNLALSDTDGEGAFYCGQADLVAAGSLLAPGAEMEKSGNINRKVTVKTRKLTSWALENGVGRIDMLWLDMQGSELAMLEASQEFIRTTSVIYTEVSEVAAYRNACSYDQLKLFLEKSNFTLEVEAIPQGWGTGNALFINRSCSGR
jgi:FkbM family methyltransferase